MKVAIIHYWWLTNRGGEAVIKALSGIYPKADLFMHVYDKELVKKTLGARFKGQIFSTFIAKLPLSKKLYQHYLPLMPLALEQLDLSAYDLIISNESGPAKGVITRPDAIHICYCLSPMRYLWDMYHAYILRSNILIRLIFPLISHWMRVWDRVSADRVDYFLADSNFVSSRISKFYRRDSHVIFPPVKVGGFDFNKQRKDFYLYLGQLVPYKKADLAVEAFNKLGLTLIIIGEGELYKELKSIAKTNIKLLGRQPFNVVKAHLEECRGLVFPGMEDFGIVPVEAMAAGAPVIAYGKGGVLDTVIDGETGVLFKDQTATSLINAVMKIESGEVSFFPSKLHSHANKFDEKVFKEKFSSYVNKVLDFHEDSSL
jgi:glycosyltransferase involved in cell wall biosynthesis